MASAPAAVRMDLEKRRGTRKSEACGSGGALRLASRSTSGIIRRVSTDAPSGELGRAMRLSICGFVFALMVGLATTFATPTRAATPDAGVVITGYATPIERQIDLADQLGVGWVTLPMSWSFYEAEPDAYKKAGTDQAARWAQLGPQLARAKERGLNVKVTFVRTPQWARQFPGSTSSGPSPAHFGDFDAFVGDVSRTYGEYIDAYATWNEPNIDLFWLKPDPAAYARLHVLAASTIRTNDPKASVVLGPIAGNAENSLSYLTLLYANGVNGTFNRVGWNTYPPGPPWNRVGRENFDGASTALAALFRRLDPGRRVWIAETGWSTCEGCPAGTPNVVSPSQQADYLLSALAIKRRYLRGLVDRIFFYSLADGPNGSEWAENHGLVRFDFKPKPSFSTIRRAEPTLTPPKLRWRRNAEGASGQIANLQLRSRRGVVRATARTTSAVSGRLRVLGYWRGSWRVLEDRRGGAGGVGISIPDVGYLAIRVQIGKSGPGWVTAQMPVPLGPKISTSS